MVTALFEAFLAQHDDGAWLRAVERIETAIHPVDRAATRIWLHFYPLALQRLMARPDAAQLARRATLAGRWRLADRIGESHWFLHGHRHWALARAAVLDYAAGPVPPSSLDLGAQIQEIARAVAERARVPSAEVTGITVVALRTLQQVGGAALAGAPEGPIRDDARHGLSAEVLLRRRDGEPRRRWFWLRGSPPRSWVSVDERDPDARFLLVHSQHLTTAAAYDTRDYRTADPRCSEGPIPVHCRSCSCGTCWIGVLGGADRLSAMEPRERDKLAECGVAVDGDRPPIRLACMAQAEGPVSIVIPPWNGLLGRAQGKDAKPRIGPVAPPPRLSGPAG